MAIPRGGWLRRCRARLAHGDDGISLIESIAAMAIVLIVGAAVLPVINSQVRLSGDNASRAAAANIAYQTLDQLRVLDDASRPIGTSTVHVTVNRVSYEVVRTLQWVSRPVAAGSCSTSTSSSESAYIRADVVVKWAGMRAKPVTTGTLLLPRSRTGTAPGVVVVRATTGAGVPLPGHSVTLTKPNGTYEVRSTDSNGCVVVTGLPLGIYSGTLTAPGYPVRSSSLPLTAQAPSYYWLVPYDL